MLKSEKHFELFFGNELEDKRISLKKNFDLYIKPTKYQKLDTNLVYIGLYLADDSTADPQYLVDSWKCITKALQPIKIEKQNLTPKKIKIMSL